MERIRRDGLVRLEYYYWFYQCLEAVLILYQDLSVELGLLFRSSHNTCVSPIRREKLRDIKLHQERHRSSPEVKWVLTTSQGPK